MSEGRKELVSDAPSFLRLLERESGLYQRLRSLAEKQRKLVIFTNPAKSPKGCCLVIAKLLQDDTGKRLKGEFKKAFPDLDIEFA